MTWLIQKMFEYTFSGNAFSNIADKFMLNPSEGDWADVWDKVSNISQTVILPLGIGLMIIWFLVEFIQKATSEQMNVDHLFLSCVKLIAAFYLMSNSFEILTECWKLGIVLVKSVAEDTSKEIVSSEYLAKAWESLTNSDWNNGDPEKVSILVAPVSLLQLSLPWITALVLNGIAYFISYSRMIDMLLRVATAPIALSDFFRDGLNSAGWRFLKTFLAICLQGAVITLIAIIYTSVASGLIQGGEFMALSVNYLVITLAAVAIMFKSQAFCRELLGV